MRKSAAHVTLDPEYVEILDEVAKRLETPLMPRHTRSGFMNKAAQRWVEAMKAEHPDLAPMIEGIQQRYESLRRNEASRRRDRVVPFERSGKGGVRRPTA
jgi:hypothetical protein